MRSSALNHIELDRARVTEELNENGEYEGDGILIRKMEPEEEDDEDENDTYVCEIQKNNSTFIGILNNEFKREGYGLTNSKMGMNI